MVPVGVCVTVGVGVAVGLTADAAALVDIVGQRQALGGYSLLDIKEAIAPLAPARLTGIRLWPTAAT